MLLGYRVNAKIVFFNNVYVQVVVWLIIVYFCDGLQLKLSRTIRIDFKLLAICLNLGNRSQIGILNTYTIRSFRRRTKHANTTSPNGVELYQSWLKRLTAIQETAKFEAGKKWWIESSCEINRINGHYINLRARG